jgi:hypothetical protein
MAEATSFLLRNAQDEQLQDGMDMPYCLMFVPYRHGKEGINNN